MNFDNFYPKEEFGSSKPFEFADMNSKNSSIDQSKKDQQSVDDYLFIFSSNDS